MCANDADACLASGAATLCAVPKVCSGAPASSCSCPALAAQPITGGGCSTAAATACERGNTNMLLTCTPVGACNVWQPTSSCAAASLVCGTKSGAADCECAPNATATFYADAVNGSLAAALPFPTGLNTPSQCRFKTLTAALTLANAAAVAGPASVIATGSTGAGSEVFNAETFPLNVNSNVTLTTSDLVPTPVNYVIQFTDNTSGQSAVVVHDQSAFSAFTVQNVNGAASSVGISTACPASPLATAKLSNVVVIGKSTVGANPALAAGLNVVSNCSVAIDATDFRSAGFGIRLIATTNATSVSVTNSTVDSNSAVGILATRGTLTVAGSTVRNNALEGIRIAPSGGEVLFTLTGGKVEGNVQGGLSFLGAGTAASTASVTNTEVRNNGSSSSSASTFFGILVVASGRTVNLVGVNVHDNAAGGLAALTGGLASGPTVNISGVSHFDTNGTSSNAAPGASATGVGTILTATGATFSSNRGAGVHVGGQAVGTFSGITVNGNGAGQSAANNGGGGFQVENGTASINATNGPTSIQKNAFNGIKESSGSLTLTGTGSALIDVSNNGIPSATQPAASSGAYIGGATFNNSFVSFHDNGNHGVEVSNTGANPIGQPISMTSCSFANNAKSGLHVDVSSPIVLTGANSLNVFSSTFTNNLHGINVAASAGDVHAAFQSNTITNSSDTGVYVTGTLNSVLNFNGNTVSNNKAVTLFGGQGVGGMLFIGTAPGAGKLGFTSNLIHHNAFNQVIAAGGVAGPTLWALNGTAGASCVQGTANTFGCYNSSPAPSASVGVVAIGLNVTVQANGNSWQNAAPAAGTDFSTAAGAIFFPAPPSPVCAASAIACP